MPSSETVAHGKPLDSQDSRSPLAGLLRAKACTHLGAMRGCVAGGWAERRHNVPSPPCGPAKGDGEVMHAQPDDRSLLRWRRIPGSVWALGIVSMLMDVSSEMIHALLPLYLVVGLGASAL